MRARGASATHGTVADVSSMLRAFEPDGVDALVGTLLRALEGGAKRSDAQHAAAADAQPVALQCGAGMILFATQICG